MRGCRRDVESLIRQLSASIRPASAQPNTHVLHGQRGLYWRDESNSYHSSPAARVRTPAARRARARAAGRGGHAARALTGQRRHRSTRHRHQRRQRLRPDAERHPAGIPAAYPQFTFKYTGSATGTAISNAKTGTGGPSVLIVHAASLENQFVAGGFSYNNQYGPPSSATTSCSPVRPPMPAERGRQRGSQHRPGIRRRRHGRRRPATRPSLPRWQRHRPGTASRSTQYWQLVNTPA